MNQVSLRPGALDLGKFVKRLGYKSARDREFTVLLKMLVSRRIVEVQQSGFLGHSLAHHKIVVIREQFELEDAERINANLHVNFNAGYYTVHRATKPFKCNACKESIQPGERYGSRVRLGRRRWPSGKRIVMIYTILCLPCLIVRYDEYFV